MCGGKKPTLAGAGEAREGLGGGFNERQERGAATLGVEIGDDGFDDFGRKKQKEKVDRKAKEVAALARLKATFGCVEGGKEEGREGGKEGGWTARVGYGWK